MQRRFYKRIEKELRELNSNKTTTFGNILNKI